MPNTEICSHSSMAKIMVNQPVLRKEPDFILQSITAMLQRVAQYCCHPSQAVGA